MVVGTQQMLFYGDCGNRCPCMLIHKLSAMSAWCEQEIYGMTWHCNKINCVDVVLLCNSSGGIQSNSRRHKKRQLSMHQGPCGFSWKRLEETGFLISFSSIHNRIAHGSHLCASLFPELWGSPRIYLPFYLPWWFLSGTSQGSPWKLPLSISDHACSPWQYNCQGATQH